MLRSLKTSFSLQESDVSVGESVMDDDGSLTEVGSSRERLEGEEKHVEKNLFKRFAFPAALVSVTWPR